MQKLCKVQLLKFMCNLLYIASINLIHAPEIYLKIAWIHTCFHHFLEIGQICHNR